MFRLYLENFHPDMAISHFRTKITLFNKEIESSVFSESDDLVEFSSRMAVEFKNEYNEYKNFKPK